MHSTMAARVMSCRPCRIPLLSYDQSRAVTLCGAPSQQRGLAARRLCNRDIVNRVQQVICFAFHDSRLLLQTCEEAKQERKIVTLFYLD